MAIANALVIGWNRAVPGREQDAVELFGAANSFYEAQKTAGRISSYEHLFLAPHGGVLNGITFLRGDPVKLAELRNSDEWLALQTRLMIGLEDLFVVSAATGAEGIGKFMKLYATSAARR